MYNQLKKTCEKDDLNLSEENNFHFMGVERLEAIMEQDSRSIFEFINDREGKNLMRGRHIATNINQNINIK